MDSFLTFINHHSLNLEKDATLLAISGGVDSVVMAHLFYKMGFKAAIAHCNFGLRGRESEEDEQFTRELAARYGFPFYTKKFDTKSFASERSVSTQMAARELRYGWFEEVRKRINHQWIASAHHANDSFETVLLNLARGTGIAGLQGIAGVNNVLLRPLLYVTRLEILKYAEENRLEWREDRSNDTDDYRRNLIRHHAIPVFQQLNPALETTFRATSEKLRSANILLNEFLEDWKLKAIRTEDGLIKISIEKVLSATEPVYRLWHLLDEYHFTYSQVQQVLESAGGISGKKFFSKEYTLLIDRDDLILKKTEGPILEPEYLVTNLEGSIQYGSQTVTFTQIARDLLSFANKDKSSILLDPAHLILPLKIRKWRIGDAFHPFGMAGKRKKVSDLFTDLKLNLFQKEEVRLLVNGNEEIIWVIGIRSDERYRVDDEVQNVIMMSVNSEVDS